MLKEEHRESEYYPPEVRAIVDKSRAIIQEYQVRFCWKWEIVWDIMPIDTVNKFEKNRMETVWKGILTPSPSLALTFKLRA